MSIQVALECWRDYIDPIEFERLTDFLVRTEAGEKLNKILVLEGQGGTGKSTFIKDLLESHFGNRLSHCDITGKLHKNDSHVISISPELCDAFVNNSQIVVFQELVSSTNIEKNLRLLISNPDFACKTLYGVTKGGKLSANFVITAYPNQLGTHLDDILLRIHFNHQF